uniref:RNase H type-1 domain-containing protein n=1 Tax=Quercus lobata TaxID=97700 RepID=A0A7N2MZM6_QUELO
MLFLSERGRIGSTCALELWGGTRCLGWEFRYGMRGTRSCMEVHSSILQAQQTWQPPQGSLFKLNFDDACFGDGAALGYGVVIRNEKEIILEGDNAMVMKTISQAQPDLSQLGLIYEDICLTVAIITGDASGMGKAHEFAAHSVQAIVIADVQNEKGYRHRHDIIVIALQSRRSLSLSFGGWLF